MNEELDAFMEMLDNIDVEEERRKDEEWKLKVQQDYKEINDLLKKISLKDKKPVEEVLDESCM